eukprot:586405-Ditylum_brightwellii.AAC.1
MEEHKDGKGSSGSEKFVVDMDDFIAPASDFYSPCNISNDVKKGAKEKMKLEEKEEYRKEDFKCDFIIG